MKLINGKKNMPTDHTNTSPDKSPHHAAYKMSTDPDSSEAMLII